MNTNTTANDNDNNTEPKRRHPHDFDVRSKGEKGALGVATGWQLVSPDGTVYELDMTDRIDDKMLSITTYTCELNHPDIFNVRFEVELGADPIDVVWNDDYRW